jgi:hypothetical protein
LLGLCPAGREVFEWAEEHLRAVPDKPFPTLVPLRRPDGQCHWHVDGRCAVHENAPYSCAFFDCHLSDAEVQRRSAATIQARRKDQAARGLYYEVWLHLCRLGLTALPGDRAALDAEWAKMRRNSERRKALARLREL